MSEQDEFYEQAFDELENDNRVKSIWAKAPSLVVPRGGIEPPTQGFSVLDS